jgi:hypothetical protein
MLAESVPKVAPASAKGSRVGLFARRLIANNWKVVLYVVLIVLCVLFAPEQPLKFIYTEF